MQVAIKNESIPRLVDTDVPCYFAPTAATRCWIGIKIFIDESGKRNHRWYAAQVDSDWDPNTNMLLSTTMENPASFPRVTRNNQLLTVPPNPWPTFSNRRPEAHSPPPSAPKSAGLR